MIYALNINLIFGTYFVSLFLAKIYKSLFFNLLPDTLKLCNINTIHYFSKNLHKFKWK